MEQLRKHRSKIQKFNENIQNENITETSYLSCLYYANCENTNFSIPNKVVKVFIENCKNCTFNIHHCISPIEIVNCDYLQVRIYNGNFIQIDLSKVVLIEIIDIKNDFFVVYCKVWDIIINLPDKNKNYNLYNDYFGEQFKTSIFNTPIRFITERFNLF